MKGHKNGRWYQQAQNELNALYDKAILDYKNNLQDGYDPTAVDSLLRILMFVRKSGESSVEVSFLRSNELPDDITERVQRESGVKLVLPVGDAFSDEKMEQREAAFLSIISDAFHRVFHEDILSITPKCETECPRLTVQYKVSSDYSAYYDLRQEKIPESERLWSPAVFFKWELATHIPDEPQSYSFTLESFPAEHVNNQYPNSYQEVESNDLIEMIKADNPYFNEGMATSAFDDFRNMLLKKFGVAGQTDKQSMPADSPTQALRTREAR